MFRMGKAPCAASCIVRPCLALLFVFVLIAAAPPPQTPPRSAPSAGPSAPGPVAQGISTVKDVLNAAFFLVVGIITILTYRQAKKTILQPLKTEIFKQQIQLFTDLLKLFVGKDEIDLREQFA